MKSFDIIQDYTSDNLTLDLCFCGASVKMDLTDRRYYIIICPDCCAYVFEPTRAQTAAKWNIDRRREKGKIQ